MTQKELRPALIDYLSTQVEEKAQMKRGGSAALVPSTTEVNPDTLEAIKHVVSVDENYTPIHCSCKGGSHNCLHRQAFSLFIAEKLASLLNDEANPRYQFQRNGKTVVARLSQFSKEEKAALVEQANNERRNRLNGPIYDVNNVA